MVLVWERNRNSQQIQILGVHSNNETVKCLCLRRFCQQGQRENFRLDEDNVVSRKFRHHCIFYAQIKPRLLYASEVWGTSRLANIEIAHLFACKRLLSVSDKTPNHMVYAETGRYPLYIDSTISSLRYWFKLSKMPNDEIPEASFSHA